MATDELRVSALIPASPNSIFAAWLDDRRHSAFTGGRATIQPWVGGRHTAWDGYIEGIVVDLDTGRRLVMRWRTTEFPAGAPDSSLEVLFEPVAGGTRVSVVHTNIPEGQGPKYKEGWRDHYLDPLKKFFTRPNAMRDAIKRDILARRASLPGHQTPKPEARPSRPAATRPKPKTAKKPAKRAAAKRAGASKSKPKR